VSERGAWWDGTDRCNWKQFANNIVDRRVSMGQGVTTLIVAIGNSLL